MDIFMKTIFATLLLSLSLYGQNPAAFAGLGDVIYNDMGMFEELGKLDAMHDQKEAIDAYIESANANKDLGFALDAKNEPAASERYLKELRRLSEEHDTIMTNARYRFKEAISDEDTATITGMIAIGAIDPKQYKGELIHYYEEFSEEQNLSVIEPLYTEYQRSLPSEQNLTQPSASYPAEPDAWKKEELLKRMRAQQKAKSEAVERAVRKEEAREKEKVMEKQKKELGLE